MAENDGNISKTMPSLRVINIDVQKVLTTPRAEIGPLYYYSKLSICNCTIFDLGNLLGTCNVWNKTIGNRGANEISSFLWSYFQEESSKGVNEFIAYSDSCSGQNKNKIIFSMYLKTANEMNIKMTHRLVN